MHSEPLRYCLHCALKNMLRATDLMPAENSIVDEVEHIHPNGNTALPVCTALVHTSVIYHKRASNLQLQLETSARSTLFHEVLGLQEQAWLRLRMGSKDQVVGCRFEVAVHFDQGAAQAHIFLEKLFCAFPYFLLLKCGGSSIDKLSQEVSSLGIV